MPKSNPSSCLESFFEIFNLCNARSNKNSSNYSTSNSNYSSSSTKSTDQKSNVSESIGNFFSSLFCLERQKKDLNQTEKKVNASNIIATTSTKNTRKEPKVLKVRRLDPHESENTERLFQNPDDTTPPSSTLGNHYASLLSQQPSQFLWV